MLYTQRVGSSKLSARSIKINELARKSDLLSFAGFERGTLAERQMVESTPVDARDEFAAPLDFLSNTPHRTDHTTVAYRFRQSPLTARLHSRGGGLLSRLSPSG
jgi:hypothetical protein